MRPIKTFTTAALLFSALLIAGCSRSGLPGLVAAEGVVLYNGEPLTEALVSLAPKEPGKGKRNAAAQTDKEGRFTLRTLGQHGVLPGEYRVSVVKHVPKTPADAKKLEQMKAGEIAAAAGGTSAETPVETSVETDNEPVKSGQPEYKNFLPNKFANPRTSGIELTVDSEGNRNITIEIKL